MREYQSLESLIRDEVRKHLIRKSVNEADGVGEKGIIVSTDPNSVSEPTKTPDNNKTKKKKEKDSEDDPNTIKIGQGNPVDLAPTTDDIKPTDVFDPKRDRKIVEEKKKTVSLTGIHFGNHMRHLRKRIVDITKTNQALADKHKIRPKEGQEANEERINTEQSVEMVNNEARIPSVSGNIQTNNHNQGSSQKESQQEKEQITELSKPENERIDMYNRAGHAEAAKKRRKNKIVHRVRQTIAGVRLKHKIKEETTPEQRQKYIDDRKKAWNNRSHEEKHKDRLAFYQQQEKFKKEEKLERIRRRQEKYQGHGPHIPLAPVPIVTRGYTKHEETIREAAQFDPFIATGQLLGNIIKILANSKRSTTSKRGNPLNIQPRAGTERIKSPGLKRGEAKAAKASKETQTTTEVPPAPTVKDVPAVKTPEPEKSAETPRREKPATVSYRIGKEWKSLKEPFKNRQAASKWIRQAQGKKGSTGSGVTFRINEGRMKDWLMDMEWHVTELHRQHKGDVEKMKTDFLKKYPGQERVFHNALKDVRGGGDDSDRWAHETRKEEALNELYGKSSLSKIRKSLIANTEKHRSFGYHMKNYDKLTKADRLIKKRNTKLIKKTYGEETLQEVSKRLLQRYISNAVEDHAKAFGKTVYGTKDVFDDYIKNRATKRYLGIDRAVQKLAKGAKVKATEETVNETRDTYWKAYPLPGSKNTAWGFKETRLPPAKDYFRGYYGEITAGSKDKTVPIPKRQATLKKIKESILEARHSKGGGAKRAGLTHHDTGDRHIINQLRAAKDVGSHDVIFRDDSRFTVDRDTANKVLDHYTSLRTPDEKEALTNRIWHSKGSFQDYLAGKPEAPKPSTGPSMPLGFKPKGIAPERVGASKSPGKRESKIAQPYSTKELQDKTKEYRPGEAIPKYWT